MHEMAKEPARGHRRLSKSNSNPSINPDGAHHAQVRQILCSGLPLTFIDGKPTSPPTSPTRTAQLLVKRAVDIILSLVGLVLLAPLFLVAWLAVRRSGSGPALVSQEQKGLNGKPIRLDAFRTLDADSRETPIGRQLRQTGLDELPRLINILNGDLSFIGPQPYAHEELASHRHAMKPGMLSWARANGYESLADDTGGLRIELDHDLAYIENFSLWLDLRIIAKTIRREFLKGSGI